MEVLLVLSSMCLLAPSLDQRPCGSKGRTHRESLRGRPVFFVAFAVLLTVVMARSAEQVVLEKY